eukprot:16208-Pleurochrysis_carterae.AAC.1
MPMPYKSIPAGGEWIDLGGVDGGYTAQEYYELGEWVIPRHAAEKGLVECFDDDVRKIFPDPIMRKA